MPYSAKDLRNMRVEAMRKENSYIKNYSPKAYKHVCAYCGCSKQEDICIRCVAPS